MLRVSLPLSLSIFVVVGCGGNTDSEPQSQTEREAGSQATSTAQSESVADSQKPTVTTPTPPAEPESSPAMLPVLLVPTTTEEPVAETPQQVTSEPRTEIGALPEILPTTESNPTPTGSQATALLAELVSAHENGDMEKWETAQNQLMALESQVASVLIPALTSTNWREQEIAAMLLPTIGQPADSDVPALRKALQSDSALVRANVASVLSQVDDQEALLLPVLVALLNESDDHLKMQAVVTLSNFGSAADVAVPALTSLLATPNVDLKQAVIQTLGHIGPQAQVALPTLKKIAPAEDGPTRTIIQTALERIATPE